MITIRQIVQNIGKGQSAVGIKAVLAELDKNYQKIKTKIAIANAGILNDGTAVHLKIPSSTPRVSYDVVLWVNSLNRMTLDTEFKCYSNSPGFAYNFAYIFNTQESLLFPEKYPEEFVMMPPKVRNPYGLYGFDKHVFAAVKFIGTRNLQDLNASYAEVEEQPVATFNEKKRELGR